MRLKRWKRATDIEISKEAGNYNIERQRTIALVKGNCQLNDKRLSKLVMEKAKKLNLLADEQHGSGKDLRSAEALPNTRLVGDSLRQKRRPGMTSSNDASSCFDRTVHSIFDICLRRLEAHPKPIDSCIETPRPLEHQTKTAFGVSKKSCTGKPSKPSQRTVKGCRPAPTGWVTISLPLIKMMREVGWGHNNWSAISLAILSLVCFMFVDDTDLVNALPHL